MREPTRTEVTAQGTGMDRRRFLRWAAPLPFLAPVIIGACTNGGGEGSSSSSSTTTTEPQTSGRTGSSSTTRPATPACDDVDATLEETEGPFYKEGAPERTDLRDVVTGTNLTVNGQVLTTSCEPVPGAILDFWQADDDGVYDNAGYTLRGWQRADDDGRYTLETIRPRLYQGRTAHIHVKVQSAENAPVLTTQLFFPGESMNGTDDIYDPSLLMNIAETADGQNGTFDFVLES